MPSLSALSEFQSSFYDIADERENAASQNLTFDELPLPKNEAPPFEYSRFASDESGPSVPSGASNAGSAAPSGDFDFSAFADVPADTPASDTSLDDLLGNLGVGADSPGDDGSSFLNSLLGGEPAAPQPEQELEQQPEQQLEQQPADEGTIPDDLLSGFSDEMESAVSDFNIEPQPEPDTPDTGEDSPNDDFQLDDFNLDGLNADDDFSLDSSGAIDLGGESPDITPGELPKFSTGSDDDIPDTAFDSTDNFPADLGESHIDMGGEMPDIDNLGDLGDFSMDFSTDESADFDSSLPDIDFPVDDGGAADSFDNPLPDMDFSSGSDGAESFDSQLPDIDFSSGLDDSNNMFGDTDSAPSGSGDEGLGPLEDFGADFSSDSIDFGDAPQVSAEDAHVSDVFSEEFHIPGIDDMFGSSKTEQTTVKPEKKGLFGLGRKKKKDETSDVNDVEEISLSQDDVNSLLKTLSAFPLNLRIVCEEIIAEQVIIAQQLSKLINQLVNGAPIKEVAAHVELITGKPVVIPKSFEKSTGAAFEAEQASFAYIFVHNFLPVLRLFAVIAALTASVIYLGYKFVYVPLAAESLYKRGYERIGAGEYQRANDLFQQAFSQHKKKNWFYAYAEAFRDQRRYMLAEGKYDELLRHYPRDKKGVLDYAGLQTYYILNYEKANKLLQRELLDYAPNDFQGLLATGDNFLAWADSDPSRFYDKYEDARFSFARLLELNGWQPPVLERMLKYFIRTDNLPEVLNLRAWFEWDEKKRKMGTETLSELGGYLLDKQLEKPKGVPNPYVESIESVRAMLLKAVREDRYLPEPHYHLARYHKNLGNTYDERLTLENAIRAFDLAKQESVKRRLNRVDAHYRYADLLINNREFFPAETQVVRGVQLFEDFLSRDLIKASPQLGQLYALKGDLEFYTKTGDKQAAASARDAYLTAEGYGYAPPEILYRTGAAYYQLEDWGNSLNYLFKASSEMPFNSRLLYALGNAANQRGDYFAAEGYYDHLLDMLEAQRVRLPVLLPNDNPQFLDLGERLMMARNNAGVAYEGLAEQTGSREYRVKAMALYAESSRAWDSITRNPETMIRARLSEIPGSPGINLGYLNAANAMRPSNDYTPGMFIRIDRDGVEPSRWEQLAPFGGM